MKNNTQAKKKRVRKALRLALFRKLNNIIFIA